MKLVAILYLVFAVFEAIMANQLKTISTSRRMDLSSFERKLASDTLVGATFPTMLFIARFGAIAFLIFLAFNFLWYFPIMLYVGGIVLSMLSIIIFRIDAYKTQYVTMLGFIALPVLFTCMWVVAITL